MFMVKEACFCILAAVLLSGCSSRGKPAATESRHPTYGATGYFCVSIIHRTLTWTTGSLACAQMLMHAMAHRGCTDTRKNLH